MSLSIASLTGEDILTYLDDAARSMAFWMRKLA